MRVCRRCTFEEARGLGKPSPLPSPRRTGRGSKNSIIPSIPGAYGVNAPAILTELENPRGTLFCRGEMEVRELGDGVTERIIYLPERTIAAVDVGDDSAGQMRR